MILMREKTNIVLFFIHFCRKRRVSGMKDQTTTEITVSRQSTVVEGKEVTPNDVNWAIDNAVYEKNPDFIHHRR